MPTFELDAITEADVAVMAGWSYEPPYDTYDFDAADAAGLLEPANRYWAVRRAGELIAYVCLGAEARVRGLGADPDTDDLGFGLRPDLMGQGLSRELMPWLIPALADQIQGSQLRVVILDWNQRSLAAYRRAGFKDVGSHTNDDGIYLLLKRSAS